MLYTKCFFVKLQIKRVVLIFSFKITLKYDRIKGSREIRTAHCKNYPNVVKENKDLVNNLF